MSHKNIKSIILCFVTFLLLHQSITGQVAFSYDVKGNQVSRTSSNTRPTAAIAATGATTFCAGDSVKLTAAGGTTYNWSNGQTTPSVFAAASGIYAVTVTTANGCSATASQNVLVNTKPTPAITGTLSVCAGSSTTLSATGGTTYRWSNNASTANITVSESGTYSVTVTNENGCTASLSKIVTINPPINARIDGSTSICQGSSTTLTGVGGVSYKWSNGATTPTISVSQVGTYSVTVTDANGCTATTSKTVTVGSALNPTVTGNTIFCTGANTTLTTSGGTSYLWSNGATTSTVTVNSAGTYTVTVTNADGCTGVTSKIVTTNPAPNVAVAGNTSFCTGSNTTLVATGGTSYLWSNGSTTPSVTITQSGSYSVTATDANGCAASQSRTITVNPLPNPVINGDTLVCSGGNATLTASGGTTYKWSNNVLTPNITVSRSGTYTVTVTDANGCTASLSKMVTVNLPVNARIDGSTSICQGSSTTLTGTGGVSYKWSTGANTPTISVLQAGTYSVTVTDANGCTAATSKTVTVGSALNLSITGNTTFCAGANTTLTTSGGTSYLWSNGATTSTVTVNLAGTYTVTVTNAEGCTGVTSKIVMVNSLPNVAISGNTAFCPDSNTTLVASGGISYRWSSGQTTPSVLVAQSGAYSVTTTDVNGCVASLSRSVTISPLPTPVITGDTSICSGNNATLTASGGTSYRWSTGANTPVISVSQVGNYSVTVTNTQGCSAITSRKINASSPVDANVTGNTSFCGGSNTTLTATGGTNYRWSNGATSATTTITQTGTYTVTVTNSSGCTAVVTRTITLNSLPNAAITINGVPSFCEGRSLRLNASGGSSYLWSTGETTTSITVTRGGTFTVTVTNTQGCTKPASQNVTMIAKPIARFTLGNIVGGQVSFINTTVGGSYYTWIFGDGKTSLESNPTNTYMANGTYTVTLIAFTGEGCPDTTKIPITITRVSTKDLPEGLKVQVSPNPTSSIMEVNISFNKNFQANDKLVLTDLLGRTITEWHQIKASNYFDISHLASGMYMLRLTLDGKVYTLEKVVKTH